MRLAERALRDGSTPVALIAELIGYASESAFSNAFKRSTGHSPKSYRHVARHSSANTRGDAAIEESALQEPRG